MSFYQYPCLPVTLIAWTLYLLQMDAVYRMQESSLFYTLILMPWGNELVLFFLSISISHFITFKHVKGRVITNSYILTFQALKSWSSAYSVEKLRQLHCSKTVIRKYGRRRSSGRYSNLVRLIGTLKGWKAAQGIVRFVGNLAGWEYQQKVEQSLGNLAGWEVTEGRFSKIGRDTGRLRCRRR